MNIQNNNVPEGFKITELGLLPKEWDITKLGEIAEAKYGKANPKESGHIPVIGSGGIFSNTSTPLVDYPTIVIGRKGTAGKVWFCPIPCYPSDTTFYLKWKKDVDIAFVFQYMSLNPLSGEHAKTTLPSLQKPYLENTIIPLPPLHEQKAIAKVLSTIQEAIEAQNKIIIAARELKKSLMRHLFTYGPVAVVEAEKVPLKETEIGPVPEHWEQKELGEVCDIVYGVQAAVANLTDPSIGIPIFTNINIRNEGTLDISTLRYYSLPDSKRDRLILRKGDVLFNWRSGSPHHVGKTAIFNLDGDYTFSSFILRFRTNNNTISNEYLFRYLNFLKGNGFFTDKRSQSSVNSVFNASLAAKIPVFLPTTSDQMDMVMTLSSIDSKLGIEENRKAVLQSLFQSMLHNLMTGKVRVKDLEV